MNILLITHAQDIHSTPLVLDALRQRGARGWRLDTDRFPTEHRLSLELGAGHDRMTLETEEGQLDLRDVEAVYYRRFAPAGQLPSTLPPQYREAAVKESRLTLLGLMGGLRCFQLDGYEKVRRAENKQLQLQVALSVGLEIPATLTTNDPEAVRTFYAQHPEGIVGKMQGSFAIYEDGLEKVVFTSRIKAEDLDALESLQYSPMTFQACIPKALELRVTVVGQQIFSAEIDSQAQVETSLDWRRDGRGLIGQWKRHTLPADLEARILRLMDAFGLNYGAMDFILTPDGRYVFLEVNPAGEFMWLQKHPGLPIAEALADVLLDRVPRRTEPEWALLGQTSAPSMM